MAKLRINGDSSGYVDLEAPNAASSSTLDLDQVPQKNAANTFTETQQITNTTNGAYYKINAPTSGDISSGYLVYQGSTIRGGFYTNPTHGMTHISDNYHTFRNNNANRMTIDSNGYVTTPYQPGFEVTLSSLHPTTTGTYTIPFNTNRHNMGSHLNTANGVFTAPVAGFYHFDCQILLNGVSNTDDSLHVHFSQNDTHKSYFNLRAPGESANGYVGYGEYLPVIGTVSSYMNANDTMRVKVQAGSGSVGVHNSDWCSFSGFLIG
jgi:hypothetical protein